MSEVYDTLNKSWKGTCKIIFGEEIGELEEYEEYLKQGLVGKEVKSHFSDKKLWVASEDYAPGVRFFEFGGENKEAQKILAQPVHIDKIKDLDSLVESVREKLIYSGNKVLGTSKNVEHSDSIIDSTNILNSSVIMGSKNIAYSYLMQYSEYGFGSTASGQSAQYIRCFYNNSLKRCFEACTSIGADLYFTYNTINCSDCMFSFNLRAKHNTIGNIELPKDKYLELKKKLVTEFSEELKEKKKMGFSIVDVVNWCVYE